ncbi:MAG: YMGG-like glycine zipper-containing protein [Segetibacter sp.]
MKKSLIAVAFAGIFAACNSNPKTSEQTNTKGTDTAGLAQFQAWKQQQAIQEQLGVIETNGVNDKLNNPNNFSTNQPSIEHGNVAREEQAAEPTVIYRDKPNVVYRDRPGTNKSVAKTSKSSGTRSSKSGGSGKVSQGSGSGTASQPTASTTPAKKKGWSKAAKGTAIGAGSGAVLGAIISKNKVKGAVIGGVLGAGGGYTIGRSKDKKDGRY